MSILRSKSLHNSALRPNLFGFDLNALADFRDVFGFPARKNSHVYRQDTVRADHGLHTLDKLRTHRRSLPRECASTFATVHRAVSRDGFCTNNLARKPSRHRSLFVRTIG